MSVHSRHCGAGGGGGGAVETLSSCFTVLLAFFFRVEPFSACGAIGWAIPPTETVAAAVEVLEAADVAVVAFMPAVAAGAYVPAACMFFANSISSSGVQKIDFRFLDGSELREIHR